MVCIVTMHGDKYILARFLGDFTSNVLNLDQVTLKLT